MRMPGCQLCPQPGWTRHPLPAVGLSFGNTEQRMRSGNVALCPGEEPLMTGPCQDCNFMAFSSRRGRNVLKMTQPCLVFLEVLSGVTSWAWSSQSFTKCCCRSCGAALNTGPYPRTHPACPWGKKPGTSIIHPSMDQMFALGLRNVRKLYTFCTMWILALFISEIN